MTFKFSFFAKVVALAGLVGLVGAAAASPIHLDGASGRILDFGKQGTYTVTTQGGNLLEYAILLKEGQNTLAIDLLEISNTDDPKSAYMLWEDTDARTDWIDHGDQIYKDAVIDLVGTISWAVDSTKQYVLMIVPVYGRGGEATSSVSAVPVPGAAWLFGSALLGFLGFSNRRKI